MMHRVLNYRSMQRQAQPDLRSLVDVRRDEIQDLVTESWCGINVLQRLEYGYARGTALEIEFDLVDGWHVEPGGRLGKNFRIRSLLEDARVKFRFVLE